MQYSTDRINYKQGGKAEPVVLGFGKHNHLTNVSLRVALNTVDSDRRVLCLPARYVYAVILSFILIFCFIYY